jgi:hypothetical protein
MAGNKKKRARETRVQAQTGAYKKGEFSGNLSLLPDLAIGTVAIATGCDDVINVTIKSKHV